MTTEAAPSAAPAATTAAKPSTQPTQAARDATPAPAGGETTPTTVPAKYKFDFEGTEREYSADELRANYLKGKNAAQLMTKAELKLREVAEREKKAGSFPERLKKEGAKFLIEHGIDPDDFAESLLLPKIQQQMLTDEQRRILDAQQRAEAAEMKLQEREEKERQAEEDRLVSEHKQRLGASFMGALEKLGLPQSSGPWAVRRMAQLAERADELEMEFAPDDLASIVKDDFMQEHRAIASGMSAEQIIEWLGEEVVQKLRRFDLDRIKSKLKVPGALPQRPVNGVAAAPKPNGKRFMTEAEWIAEEQRRIREG